MYKCVECGHIFEDGEEHTYVETHGFTSGPYEHFSVCPVCGESYEEAVYCKECQGAFLEEELTDGFCPECKEDE